MASRGRNCLRTIIAGQFKRGHSLPPSNPISAGNEFLEWHTETVIDQEFSILLRHHDVILLAQITNHVLDPRRLGRGSIGAHRFSGELVAALGQLASTAHSDALYLFRR